MTEEHQEQPQVAAQQIETRVTEGMGKRAANVDIPDAQAFAASPEPTGGTTPAAAPDTPSGQPSGSPDSGGSNGQ